MAVADARITIVGCGPGAADYLTVAAIDAVERADVLIGPQRLLDLFPTASAERIAVGPAVEDTLGRIQESAGSRKIAVLVTGDPGLFSLARLIIDRAGRECCRIVPGISSVQMAFARIGLDWADALIISAHKNDPEFDASWLAADKIAVLGGRDSSFQWIAERLLPAMEQPRLFVCEDLSLEDEAVREIAPMDLPALRPSSRTIILIVRSAVFS